MFDDGVRLVLVVAVPLAAAALVHEVGDHTRGRMLVALVALLVTGALAASVAGDTAGGGTVERSFGAAIPGATLTARADSASITAALSAVVAALLALASGRVRAEGLLLVVAGTATVAVSGTVVLTAGGAMVAGAGVLLLTRPGGPGRRSAAVLAGIVVACGLGLIAAAAQLVAQSGSSDPTVAPATAFTDPVAIPWAIAGVGLLIAPLLAGQRRRQTPVWAAAFSVPSGFLVLLRLQQAGGGQLPPVTSALFGSVGTLVAVAAALAALRAREPRAALVAVCGVLTASLIVLLSDDLAGIGDTAAALVVALELAWLAGVVTPAARSGATVAALPGGLGIVALTLAAGPLVERGAGGSLQLVVLVGAAACSAVAAGRQLTHARPPQRGIAAALPVLAAALAGGILPGVAVALSSRVLALGVTSVGVDAGTVAVPGSSWSGGYVVLAVGVVVLAALSARVLAGAAPALPAPAAAAPPRAVLGAAVAARRRLGPPARTARARALLVDLWLVGQPGVAMVAIAAGLAIVAIR